MAKRKIKNKRKFWITVAVILVLAVIGSFMEDTPQQAEITTTTVQEETTSEQYSVYNTSEGTAYNQTEPAKTVVTEDVTQEYSSSRYKVTTADLPEFNGSPYVVINENVPGFTEDEITSNYFEIYSPLDDYGRCTVAFACLGVETAPTEERGEIGSVKPTGWHTVKYDCVDGKYLYNRCHLIGFQLSGENANTRNLITGTRYMNVDGMLPFENMVDDYIEETGNHVMYRVTPVFVGDELVARGVQMEAFSVEDDGDGICFNVYCFNAQPGVAIDYSTGLSQAE